MKIENNIIREYLKNVYFITGTAYAGKSTACAMLAEKYGLVHCGENYCTDFFLSVAQPDRQPNMCWFSQIKDWQTFVMRDPDEYEQWINGNSRELAEFEVAELISISEGNRVIVDTNIPIDILREISDYSRVAVMLSPQSMSIDRFFDRNDPEKRFLLEQINMAADPDAAMANFRECLSRVNSKAVYDEYAHSGFFTLVRDDDGRDTRQEVIGKLAEHFGFDDDIIVCD